MNKLLKTRSIKYEITREQFIELVGEGLYISPLQYEFIYEDQLEPLLKEGMSINDAINKWVDENDCMIIDTEFSGKFRYLYDDDTLCSMDIEKPTALDIIEWMAERHDEMLLQRDKTNDNIDELIANIKKLIKVIELGEEAFNMLYYKFKEAIVNDTYLSTRISLYNDDIHNTLRSNKSIFTEEEYTNAEFLLKEVE